MTTETQLPKGEGLTQFLTEKPDVTVDPKKERSDKAKDQADVARIDRLLDGYRSQNDTIAKLAREGHRNAASMSQM